MKRKTINIIILNIIIGCLLLFMILNLNTIMLVSWCFVISLIFSVYYVKKHVAFLSASFFFIVFYIMLFYLQPILLPLLDISLTNNIHVFRVFSILVIIGLHLFILGNSFILKEDIDLYKNTISQNSINKAVKVLGIILLISFTLSFIDAGTLNILSLGRAELKNSGSILRFIATMGFYSTSLMFFLVFYSIKSRKITNIVMWIVLFIIIEATIFLLFRTRSLMVVHMCSVLVGLYYNSYYLGEKSRVTLITKLFTSIIAIIILVSAVTFRFFRGYLQPNSNLDNFQFDLNLFLRISLESGDLGYSTTVIQLINYVPDFHDYLYGQSYYRLFFTFIPRFIWDDKPINTQQTVASWLMPEVEGQSIPPGIIGDLYINFGVVGVLFMILFGIFIGLLDKNLTVKHILICASSDTWIFHMVRGGFTNPIIIFLFLLLITLFLSKYIFKTKENIEYKTNKIRFGG